jgi:hypothetical protein
LMFLVGPAGDFPLAQQAMGIFAAGDACQRCQLQIPPDRHGQT